MAGGSSFERTDLFHGRCFAVCQYDDELLSAIEIEARKQGYFVNITLHEQNREMEKEQLERLADYHADGIILSSVNQGDAYKEFLQSLDTPVVTIGNRVADGIPFVGIQEKKAAKEAVKLLFQLINGEEGIPETIMLDCEMVDGETL